MKCSASHLEKYTENMHTSISFFNFKKFVVFIMQLRCTVITIGHDVLSFLREAYTLKSVYSCRMMRVFILSVDIPNELEI